MAPLNDTGTARVWVDYNDGIFSHTLKVRYKGAVSSPGLALAAVADLFLAIASDWYQITITGARNADQDDSFSFPVTWPGLASYGGGAMPRVFAPRQFALLGRDNQGRRMRMFLFGYEGNSPDIYRLARVAGNVVDDALLVIEAAQANGIFVSITNVAPTMYQYADFNFNNYYERQARG